MTQPQTNPTNPTDPTDPINPAIPANPDDANTDPQTEPQTVAFEQTSVTDPATGDTVTETIEGVASSADAAAQNTTAADAGTTNVGMPSEPYAFDNPSDFGAPTADASTAAYAQTTPAAYAQMPAPAAQQPVVDSMGNPYAATSTSSPYEHAPAYGAGAPTMPMGAYAAPDANSAQQPNYGAQPQPSYATPTTYYVARNKILAGLLAFFFGMFGIHNFYLGYTGRGIAQLLLTVLGWIALGLGPLAALIWSWIEGVRILTSDYGTPEHRDARGVELMD